jgi:hypothetical protein
VNRMEILGEPIAKLTRKYAMPSSFEDQLQWKKARVTVAGSV